MEIRWAIFMTFPLASGYEGASDFEGSAYEGTARKALRATYGSMPPARRQQSRSHLHTRNAKISSDAVPQTLNASVLVSHSARYI
jgi:hypothetical protein